MTNDNREKFLKDQEQHHVKYQYLGGTRSNEEAPTSDPNYNNRNDTDISPGAEGRTVR